MSKIIIAIGALLFIVIFSAVMVMRYAAYHSPSIVSEKVKEKSIVDRVFFPILDLFFKKVE